jgi:hypothetical protein
MRKTLRASLLALLVAPLYAQEAELVPAAFVTRRAALAAEAVPRLEALAAWCAQHKLYLERHRLYEGLLSIEPDHSDARRGLKYFRRREGWVQSRGYRVPRNHDDAALVEYRERFQREVGPYRDGVLALLADRDLRVPPAAREAAVRELLTFTPDDVELRRSVGEARGVDGWVLLETASTLRARAELAHFAEACIEGAPRSERAEATRDERGVALPWTTGRETERVRVLGTVNATEIAEAAEVAHAVGDYFERVFRQREAHRPGFRVYLLRVPEQAVHLRALSHGVDPADLDRTFGVGSVGGWIAPNAFGQWSPDRERRLDGTARQALGAMLLDAFGVDTSNGWVWEGLGLYLVEHLVGTRKTYFIDRGAQGASTSVFLWKELQDPRTDWFDTARGLIEAGSAPSLEFLIGRPVDTMRDEDLLFSYVLAAYLFEGRPREVPELLRRLGAGEHPVSVFEGVFGISIPQLEARLLRWLEETRS